MVVSEKGALALKDEEKSTFTISLFLHALVLLPILIADRYNIDDWGRAVMGYLNWGVNGRPFADFVVAVLDLGRPLVDFSPISQIGSIICLSWLSVIVARKFEIRGPMVAALSTLAFGANPFYLANLAFKFDSLPMTLSLALALMPVVMDKPFARDGRRSIVIGAVLLLASLCTYQASLNAFLVVACLEFLFQQKKNHPAKAVISLLKRRLAQFLIAIVLYKIVALLTVQGQYAEEHSNLVAGSGALASISKNLITFWTFALGMLTGALRATLVFPIVLSLLASIALGLRYSVRTAVNFKILWIAGAFVTPLLMLFGTFGFLIFFESPTGGPRTFIGFGALLASSLILITSLLDEFAVPGKLQCLILCVPAYAMIGFAAIYGNAMKAQKYYENHIAENLTDNLKEILAGQSAESLSIEGNVGYAPLVNRMGSKRYRLLFHLVPVEMSEGGLCYPLLTYYGINVPPVTSEARRTLIIAKSTTSTALRSSVHYKIFLLDHNLLVRLSSGT